VVEITIKNLIMSSAQYLNHKKEKKSDYALISNNISDRCINLLKELDTKLVTKKINQILCQLDNMGNSFDSNIKYTEDQKNFIKINIQKIAQ